MVFELGKENPDAKKFERITAEIGTYHQELKNITIEYYQQMNSKCDLEQKKKLNEIFMSMVNKNEDGKNRQRGRRYRHGNQ
jgi:hypothetical protein